LPVEFSLLIVIETLRALESASQEGRHGRPLGIVTATCRLPTCS
jgi:hypothetical protein